MAGIVFMLREFSVRISVLRRVSMFSLSSFERSFSPVHKIGIFPRSPVYDVSLQLGVHWSVSRAREDLAYGSDGLVGQFDALPP